MPDRIAFPAQIKLISVKSLQSLDTEGELRIRFLPTDEVLEVLHRLHRGDANVTVVVMPDSEINNKQLITSDAQVQTRRSHKPKG
jgi:hypothetical protein